MKAYLKQVRISPKKANLVAALVRQKNVEDAINLLKFTPKKAAPILRKLLESAAANAEHNNKQKRETLHVKEIIVTEGPTYKRSVPISRGRVHPILKRTSHITVKLEQSQSEAEAQKATEPPKASEGAPKKKEDLEKVKPTEKPEKTEKTEKEPKKEESTTKEPPKQTKQ